MNQDLVQQYLDHPNVKAFLRAIRLGESDPDTDEAYMALFGWKVGNGHLFNSYSDHPRKRTYEKYDGQFIKNNKIDYTTAAGAYQIVETTWNNLRRNNTWLVDFSPHMQDLAAVCLIIGRGAISYVLSGNINAAIAKLGDEWASLPSATVGQPTKPLEQLIAVYRRYGGVLAGEQATTPQPQAPKPASEFLNQPTAGFGGPPGSEDNPLPTIQRPSPLPTPSPDVTPDTPTQPAPEPKEKKVVAPVIIGAAIDAMFTYAPKLLDLFKGSSDNAKRNVEAVKTLLEVGKVATGAANEQQMMEILEADPAAVTALRAEVERRWFELHKASEKSIADARVFSIESSNRTDVRKVAGEFTFIEFFSILLVALGGLGIGLMVWGELLSQATVDSIAMLAVVGTIIAVREFWLGSSAGSRAKDDDRRNKDT